MMTIDWAVWRRIKGFMAEDEARRLYQAAEDAAGMGPLLEIGSYCGKSAYVMGCACKSRGSVLFSVDHHTGSEEQQPGEAYFDPELYDRALSRVNTLPFFHGTLVKNGLTDIVIPVIGSSECVGRFWQTPLAMVFIDGGHSFESALADFNTWAAHIKPGGFLVFHDIFLDPEKGGQAPRRVYDMACGSDDFIALEMTQTLGVLKRR